jgi:TetR/AcrR family transcriptional regulator, mexJK operon transcriptional repressor
VEPEPENRTARKRRAIMDAATEAFLRGGYRGTSMDEIAAAAGVSKQTVYKQFSDKERLFVEIITGTAATAGDPVQAGVRELSDTDDPARDLPVLARRQLALVMQPQVLRLRRLVIAEAARFPELGRAFYEQGAGRTTAALAEAFAALDARGLLRVPDPALAANHFNWLVMSAPVNRAMLLGLDDAPDPVDLQRWADEGVRAFLAVYGGSG